jgi:hypothetical protein
VWGVAFVHVERRATAAHVTAAVTPHRHFELQKRGA